MKIKHFLLAVTTLVTLLAFGACKTHKDNKNEMVAKEIVKLVQDLNQALGDSTITEMSLSTVDNDAISAIQVVAPVDSGKRYAINVYVNDGKYSDIDFDFETLVAITAIIFIFGTPIFIAIIICMAVVRIKKNNNNVSMLAIERGVRLPDSNNATLYDKLQSGIKMVAWSTGLFLFFMIIGADGMASLAIIPLLIGAGRLLAYFLEKRDIKNSSTQKQSEIPPIPPTFTDESNKDNINSTDAI